MSDEKKPQGNGFNTTLVTVIVVLLVLVLGLYWFWLREPEPVEEAGTPVELPTRTEPPAPPPVNPPDSEPTDETPEEPEPEPEPQATEPDPEPLPALNESDEPVMELAESLSPDGKLVELLVPEGVLLKMVRAVIALEEGNVVKDYRPVQSPEPPFKVLSLDEPLDPEVGQRYRIDPANYERYDVYVDVLARVDKQRLADMYHRYYPLLDEAYQQYGVNRGGFLNVTLRAIDAILAADVPDEETVLVQPKVFYEFQDEELEELPGPHKLLYRMGPENARRVKENLRELRDALNQ